MFGEEVGSGIRFRILLLVITIEVCKTRFVSDV